MAQPSRPSTASHGSPVPQPPRSERRPLQVAGMVGPRSHPDAHGFRPGDAHLIVNDRSETLTAWSFEGVRLFSVPALARGQGGDREWNRRNTDTPPGLYRSGRIYRDYTSNARPVADRTLMAYGWATIDLVELEGQEARYGRAGIAAHGGGSALGWPGAWQPLQPLLPTWGCIRLRNQDLQRLILPLHDRGRVFWSVFQEA